MALVNEMRWPFSIRTATEALFFTLFTAMHIYHCI